MSEWSTSNTITAIGYLVTVVAMWVNNRMEVAHLRKEFDAHIEATRGEGQEIALLRQSLATIEKAMARIEQKIDSLH